MRRDYSAIILISAEGRREIEGIVGAVTDPLQVLQAVEGQLWKILRFDQFVQYKLVIKSLHLCYIIRLNSHIIKSS